MKPNNYYYRQIAELVTGETYLKFFSSMYYMRKIAEHYKQETYSTIKSSNKYLKDWYVELTEEEEPQTHKFNLWYLRRIAKYLDSTISENSLNENQCLQVIMDNTSTTTSVKISGLPSSAIVDTAITLTVTVKDEYRSPVSGASVTIEEDGTELTTITTGSDGTQTYTYTPSVVSSHTITATYDEYSDEQSITVSKHTTSISCTIAPTTLNYGGTLTAMGTLYIDGEPAPANKRVYIYDGSTQLGYDDTASNGAFRYDKNNVTTTGTMSVKAVFNTDDKYVGYETTPVTVTVSKRTPYLTISEPSITYDDPFTVTGTLKSAVDGYTISGASVTLTYSINSGESQTISETTGIDGTVTFDMSAPDSMGVYSLQLSYDGNSEFNSTTSNLVEEDVEKKGTILGLNSPTSGAVVSTGNLFVRGTLTDNDASPKALAGKTILAKIGNTTIGTFTTYGNDGIFSGDIQNSELSVGYNTIDFYFMGTSEYEGDSVTGISVRKVAPSYTGISVSADNPILSYADSDSATITAQLVDSNDDPVTTSGVTVYLYKDSTLWDTMQTDSGGKVQKTYTSAGAGDIEFGATDGTLTTVTETVQDCLKYDTSEHSQAPTSSNWADIYDGFTFPVTSSFEVCFDFKASNNSTRVDCSIDAQRSKNFGFGVSGYSKEIVSSSGIGDGAWENYSDYSYGTYLSIKILFNDNKLYWYVNDTLKHQINASDLLNYNVLYFNWRNWGNYATTYVKNVKIKPLNTLSLTSDVSVLSYADSDSATLTATHSDGTGKTVQLYDASDDSLIGTMTDNLDGTYSYTYTSQGVGDVSFYAKSGSLESETYAIEDCKYYNDGSSVGSLEISSGVSCTSNGDYITITTSTSGEKYVYIPTILANSDNWIFEVELAGIGQSQPLAMMWNNANYYGGVSQANGYYFSQMDNRGDSNRYRTVGDVYTVKRENGVTSVSVNETTFHSRTVNHLDSFKCGFYTNNGKSQYVKNIKIKQL